MSSQYYMKTLTTPTNWFIAVAASFVMCGCASGPKGYFLPPDTDLSQAASLSIPSLFQLNTLDGRLLGNTVEGKPAPTTMMLKPGPHIVTFGFAVGSDYRAKAPFSEWVLIHNFTAKKSYRVDTKTVGNSMNACLLERGEKGQWVLLRSTIPVDPQGSLFLGALNAKRVFKGTIVHE